MTERISITGYSFMMFTSPHLLTIIMFILSSPSSTTSFPSSPTFSSLTSPLQTLDVSSQDSPSHPTLLHLLKRRAATQSVVPSHDVTTTLQRRDQFEARTSLEQLSPKRFFDFLTDPSLLITVLHSLEVAYWTFPFGFILTPVINFFRVPNRRSSDSVRFAERIRGTPLNDADLRRLHKLYMKSLERAQGPAFLKNIKKQIRWFDWCTQTGKLCRETPAGHDTLIWRRESEYHTYTLDHCLHVFDSRCGWIPKRKTWRQSDVCDKDSPFSAGQNVYHFNVSNGNKKNGIFDTGLWLTMSTGCWFAPRE